MKNSETSTLDRDEKNSVPEEPFLRRWSKRKLSASNAAEDELDGAHQQAESSAVDPVVEQPQQELTDEDMPPLETLDENSDYSGFFSPKVSETLRRQALRKLFHFQQFNITDGLNDYDDDFTHFEKLGNVVTHEMKRLLEREAAASQEKISGNGTKQVASTQAANPSDSNDGVEAHSEAHPEAIER